MALICAAALCLLLGGPELTGTGGVSAQAPAAVAAPGDAALRERLVSIFGQLDGLGDVRVDVTAGVVSLNGTVTSAGAREQAVALAQQQDGVVAVNDELSFDAALETRLSPVVEKSVDRLQDLVAYLPLLVIALIVVVVFWFLASAVSRWDALLNRMTDNLFLRNLLRSALRLAIVLAGVLIALDILDAIALVGAVFGAAGVVGIALGFAFKDTVENYIAGLLLSFRRPFRPNDHVVVDDHEGQVLRMTSRATILLSFDGNHVMIPNARVFQGTLTNFTRNPQRRFDFPVGVATDVNLVEAQQLARDTLGGMRGVLDLPAPSTTIDSLGDSNVVVHVYGWVDQSQVSFARVRSEAIRLVKRAYDKAGYEMPEPIYRLRWTGEAPAAATVSTQPDSKAPGQPVQEESEEVVFEIQPETTLDRQIAQDRAQTREGDLLDTPAKME